jgi:hypothetical protein
VTSIELKKALRTKQEKEIRDDWFKNHRAQLIDGPAKVVRWVNPDSWCFGVIIIFYGRLLFFAGDLGEATFCLTWEPQPNVGPPQDLHYFLEKMSAATDRDPWDSELASLVVKEAQADGYITRAASRELVKFDDREEFQAALRRSYDSSEMESETASQLFRAGEHTHARKISYWIAWQMAAEQLKAAEGPA